jgi:hypothetical protein
MMMCRIALSALLVPASWPAVAGATESIKHQTVSGRVTAKRHVASKVYKRSMASGITIILGIAY